MYGEKEREQKNKCKRQHILGIQTVRNIFKTLSITSMMIEIKKNTDRGIETREKSLFYGILFEVRLLTEIRLLLVLLHSIKPQIISEKYSQKAWILIKQKPTTHLTPFLLLTPTIGTSSTIFY